MSKRKYYPKQSIFKREKQQVYISFFVGAGAVENAWNPVIRALQPFYEFELDGDTVNLILARMVYLLKWHSSFSDDFNKSELVKHIEFSKQIKKAICFSLANAQKDDEINVREEFYEIVHKFLFVKNNQSFVVSTNWDTVVDQAINKIGKSDLSSKNDDIRTFHVHGSIENEEFLYLPTEVTRESYRSYEEDQKIGQIHGAIMKALDATNISIIYGLSLSPLDIELCQTLAAGWDNPNLEKIIIIDMNHYMISQRVKSLLRKPKQIKIVAYHPHDLEKEIDYTI